MRKKLKVLNTVLPLFIKKKKNAFGRGLRPKGRTLPDGRSLRKEKHLAVIGRE